MKVIIFSLIVVLLLTCNVTAISVSLDGVPSQVDVYSQNGRSMVPVRFISESFGAKVTFIPETSLIIINYKSDRIVMKTHENWAIVNKLGKSDSKKLLDSSGLITVDIKDNRSYVPLRFLVENLGGNITWDSSTGVINVLKSR